MSTSRRCDIYKATDGSWYMLLGDEEHAWEAEDCSSYGPFDDEKAAERYLDRNFSNPGAINYDSGGTRKPPAAKDLRNKVRRSYSARFR